MRGIALKLTDKRFRAEDGAAGRQLQNWMIIQLLELVSTS